MDWINVWSRRKDNPRWWTRILLCFCCTQEVARPLDNRIFTFKRLGKCVYYFRETNSISITSREQYYEIMGFNKKDAS